MHISICMPAQQQASACRCDVSVLGGEVCVQAGRWAEVVGWWLGAVTLTMHALYAHTQHMHEYGGCTCMSMVNAHARVWWMHMEAHST